MNKFYGYFKRLVKHYLSIKRGKGFSKLPKELLEELHALENAAFKEGAAGSPNCDSIKQIWNDKIDLYKSLKGSPYLIEIADLQTLLNQLKEDLKNCPKELLKKEHLQAEQHRCDAEIIALEDKSGDPTEALQELYDDLKEYQAKLNDWIIQHGGKVPVEKSSMDRRWGILGTFIGMTAAEASLTYSAIENLGIFPSIGIILFIVTYGSIIGALCHLAGYYHSKNSRKGYFRSGAGAISFAVVIILLRMYGQEEEFGWILNIINILFVLAAILISSRLHENAEYWKLKAKISKLHKAIDRTNHRLRMTPKKGKAIEKRFDNEAGKKADKDCKSRNTSIRNNESKLKHQQTKSNALLAQIKAYRNEGLDRIQQSFLKGRGH